MSCNLFKIKDLSEFIGAKVRERGIFYCIKAGFLSLIRVMIFYPIGFILSPFCLVLNIKFLNILTSRIGHLSLEPDCYIKEEILGKHPKYKVLILAPRGKVANEHLLSYWDKYFKIIRSPIACILLRPLSENPFTIFNVRRYGSFINKTVDYPVIQDAYYKSGGRSLLVLTKFDHDRGWDLLEKIGVPRGAWFVCLHCREESYISGEGQSYRNANVDNYLSALEAIVEKGGWVIRLGDPGMKLISPQKNVIDYAHLDSKSDWMDIFLSVNCKFFIGSASGLGIVASIYGVPVVTVNNAPMSTMFPYGPLDIGIPKLMRRKGEEGQYLSFKEVLNSPIGDFRFDYFYANAGIEAVQNSPQDIRDLAIEMSDRLEGKLKYSEEDERRQARFKALFRSGHYSYGAGSRAGRDFLRKYEYLL